MLKLESLESTFMTDLKEEAQSSNWKQMMKQKTMEAEYAEEGGPEVVLLHAL